MTMIDEGKVIFIDFGHNLSTPENLMEFLLNLLNSKFALSILISSANYLFPQGVASTLNYF